MSAISHLVPLPANLVAAEGIFQLASSSAIFVDATPEAVQIGEQLAALLRPATGLPMPVVTGNTAQVPSAIRLTTETSDSTLGAEGYALTVTPDGVTITALQPAGLFYGMQTLRQLLPPAVEPGEALAEEITIPAVTIRDSPRFAWRGAKLDVARHFFGVADVKHFIDLMALYKLNRLHLHLSDDQGWRIEVKSWPRLTEVGGSTQVGGGPSGYYTQAEYADLVAYAQARYITVVPEIDTPGHTNAALAAYAELNADEQARELYTGTRVGFSTLNVDSAITYQFLDDVIRELAALTPGPVIHIGGDEAAATPHDEYLRFVERIQPIVHKYGKQVAGWEEIGQGTLRPGTLVQYWNTMSPRSREFVARAVAQGAQLIVSPASKIYLDMKYTEATPLGLTWAGYVEAQTAYDWDPVSFLPGIDEAAVAGVEAALWAETITTFDDIAFMTLPRLASVAEVAWSPAEARNWQAHRQRLAAQAPRWQALDLHYYPSPQVPWEA